MKFTKIVTWGIGIMVGMIIGIALVGLYSGVKNLASYRSLIDHETRLDDLSNHCHMSMYQARRYEKNFIIRRDMNEAMKQQKYVDSIRMCCDTLGVIVQNNRKFSLLYGMADSIKLRLDTYETAFKTVVDATVTTGLTEESGLQGEFRKQIHVLSNELEKKGNLNAEILLLKIRKDEKDFLLRGDKKYVDGVIAKIEQLKSAVGNDPVLTGYATKYQSGFLKLVEQKQHAQIANDAMITAARSLEPMIEEFEKVAEKSYAKGMTNTEIRSVLLLIILFVLSGIGIAIGVYIAKYLVAKTKNELGAEPDVIGAITSEIAKGNVHLDFTEYEYLGNTGIFKDMKQMAGGILQSVEVAERVAEGDISVISAPAAEDALGNALYRLTTELNRVVTGIRETSERLDSSASEVSEASQLIAESSAEQAATIEQITISMNEIAKQASQNSGNAAQVLENAKSVEDAAKLGVEDMYKLRTTMNELLTTSKQVEKIIKVIDDIAFQTNLLALNATVEAARAGVHGKGFAVVADEVRSLAARSARAAGETAQLINASSNGTEKGAEMANTSVKAFMEIVDNIGKMSTLLSSTVEGAREQEHAVNEINIGLDHLGVSIQDNTAISEKTAVTSEQMSTQAVELNTLVRFFTITSDVTERNSDQRIGLTDMCNSFDDVTVNSGDESQVTAEVWGSDKS